MKSKPCIIAIILFVLALSAGAACRSQRESAVSPAAVEVTAESSPTATTTATANLPVFTPPALAEALWDANPAWSVAGAICAATVTAPTPTPAATASPPRPLSTPDPEPTFNPGPGPASVATGPLLHPAGDPVYIGDSLPAAAEAISAANYTELRRVAQWGRGGILGLAFSPDGRYFVAGSEFGLAVYDRQAPADLPQWLPLDPPFFYESLYFDDSGAFILLQGQRESQIRAFPGGELRTSAETGAWLRWTLLSERWGTINVIAPDRRKKLVSYAASVENSLIDRSVRQIVNPTDSELLYEMGDGTYYVEYNEWHEPEGCDLSSFSMCGNAYDPSALHPYRAGFSPAGNYLAILYRAPNLWNSERFSTLRVYDDRDGRLLNVIGSAEQPVSTFAFSPDGATLLVGFQSGIVQLWDVANNSDIFGAWHFNAPLLDLTFSPSGSYLALQRPERLEVRRGSDGSLLGQYPANAFALSPAGDFIALGDEEGTLVLKAMDSQQDVYRFQAHDGSIFALAYSPDGQTLVSSGQDCTVKSWAAETGAFSHELAENETDAYEMGGTASRIFIYFLDFLPGGQQLIGYGSWSRVVNWDIASGATRYLIEPEPLAYYQGMMTLNPHFPEFMSVDAAGGQFYIDNAGYDLASGESTGEFRPPENLPAGCAMAGPLTADGQLRFTLGYDDRQGQICVLDAADSSLRQAIEIFPPVRDTAAITWLYLSPAGDRLMVTTNSGVVLVYQIGVE